MNISSQSQSSPIIHFTRVNLIRWRNEIESLYSTFRPFVLVQISPLKSFFPHSYLSSTTVNNTALHYSNVHNPLRSLHLYWIQVSRSMSKVRPIAPMRIRSWRWSMAKGDEWQHWIRHRWPMSHHWMKSRINWNLLANPKHRRQTRTMTIGISYGLHLFSFSPNRFKQGILSNWSKGEQIIDSRPKPIYQTRQPIIRWSSMILIERSFLRCFRTEGMTHICLGNKTKPNA